MDSPLNKLVQGVAVLKDWLGDGMNPVAEDLAGKRAGICVDCHANMRGRWWEKSTNTVANAIRGQMEAKHGLQLETEHDEQLGTCGLCFCNLPLKVWCPMEHILAHTPKEDLTSYPDHCWIKTKDA